MPLDTQGQKLPVIRAVDAELDGQDLRLAADQFVERYMRPYVTNLLESLADYALPLKVGLSIEVFRIPHSPQGFIPPRKAEDGEIAAS